MRPARRRDSARRVEGPKAAVAPHPPSILTREDPPPSPKQRRSRLRRDALLRAGVELFGRSGYEATTIVAIAKQARLSVGSFYQHFRSKRQLLLVLMNELLQRLEKIDMQPTTGDLRARIESVLDAGLATDLAYAGAYRAWSEAVPSDPKLAALDEKIRAWTTGRLRIAFGSLQQFARARNELDVALFARVMDSLFWELLRQGPAGGRKLVAILGHIVYHSIFRDSHSCTQ